MYKIYFRQAIQMIRQNPFMSGVAIAGTALAIMMIMSLIVAEEVKNIPAGPEINRNQTYYIFHGMEKDTIAGWSVRGNIVLELFREYIADMQVPDAITAVCNIPGIINLPSSKEFFEAKVKATNSNYWKIYNHSFIEGAPFTPEAFQSGMKDAVISKKMALQLFKGEPAMGQTFEIFETPFRVVGIVKDVSTIFTMASADIWVPYTSDEIWGGGVNVAILLKNKKEYPKLIEEVRSIERKYGTHKEGHTLYLNEPAPHKEFLIYPSGNSAEALRAEVVTQYRKRIFIFLLLLLVPAINLSGLSLSRIKKRMEEIGVRKAFGAKKHIIIIQVLYENLITSLIGGVIGLLLSYLILFQMKQWLLGIGDDQTIPLETLISFPVILSVTLVCILLNLLSAGIPAWRAASTSIITSITQNDKKV